MPIEIDSLKPAEYSRYSPRRQVRFAGQLAAFRRIDPQDQIDMIAARRLQDGQQDDYFIKEDVTDSQLIDWVTTPQDPHEISKNECLIF